MIWPPTAAAVGKFAYFRAKRSLLFLPYRGGSLSASRTNFRLSRPFGPHSELLCPVLTRATNRISSTFAPLAMLPICPTCAGRRGCCDNRARS